MKFFKLFVYSIIGVLLGVILINDANAAKTYTLNLTITDSEAATRVTLYPDEGNLSIQHGISKCSKSYVLWLSDDGLTVNYQKIGAASKIRIRNSTGKIVGLGTLNKVGWIANQTGPTGKGTCTYSAKLKVSKSDFYTIESAGPDVGDPSVGAKEGVVKHKWSLSYDVSYQELVKNKWKLSISS